METRSIKPGASVLKFEKGEYALSSEDRSRAEESRLRQRPEREAFRLGDNLLLEGVDRHLGLLLRLPHPDVQVPALDLFFPDHDDVRNPFFSAVRIFFASVSSESSRSAHTSGRRSSKDRAYASWSPRTGTMRTWVGASHIGSIGVWPAFVAAAAFSRSA